MNRTSIHLFFQKYGELLLHLVFIWWYFGSLNVLWKEDWLDRQIHENTIRPLSALIFLVFAYFNAFVLIPRFLKKKQWLRYGLIILLITLVIESLRSIVFIQLSDKTSQGFGQTFIKEFLGYNHLGDPISLGLIISTAYVFTKDWMINLGLIEKLRAEKLSTELAYLKSQVDPHFLFNTLNSLYAQALEEKSFNTADGIAKLGTLMRYNLHDSQADAILLGKEIDYIQKYIDLQKLRTTDQNQVDFAIQIEEGEEQIQIAPMLLIPFIENAFKYGVSPTETTFIRISVKLEKGHFKLQVNNSIIANAQSQEKSGFGLQNVKKRLELIYPNRHQLTYEKTENIFSVNLEINLTQ